MTLSLPRSLAPPRRTDERGYLRYLPAIAVTLVLGVVTLPFAATTAPSPVSALLVGVVLILAGGLSLHLPVPAAIVCGLILTLEALGTGIYSGIGFLVAYICLALCAVYSSPRVTWLMAVWYTVVLTILNFHYALGTTFGVIGTVVSVFLAAASLGIGFGFRAYIQRSRREQAEHLAQLDAQRRAVARELHDTGVRATTQMVLLAETASLAQDLPAEARAELRRIATTGRQATEELRALLSTLRQQPGQETELTFPPFAPRTHTSGGELHWSCILDRESAQLREGGFTVDTDIEDAADDQADTDVPLPVLDALDRIMSELSTNVLRHADPEEPIAIMGHRSPDQLQVLITNRSGDAARTHRTVMAPGGSGLQGAHERAAAVGGHLDVHADGSTHRVTLTLPTARSER
ncbi:MAG: histidine kinase [Brachybacterium sp.]|nr:histidine kinase [Brachybacterium sp.]